MASLVKIPYVDKMIIQQYVGFSSFQKGEEYVLNQAIHQGKLKKHILTALCQGHAFDPYRVQVIFNSEGIQHGHCSCPVGKEGKCKHIAALLLTWLDHPELFDEWEDLKLNLQAYDASTLLELIDLLDDNVEDSPEIIRAFNKHLQTVRSPCLARYVQRIDEAFHPTELPWYHPDEGGLTEIAFSLDKICSDADLLLEEGQVEEAIRIDQCLIQQILNHLDNHLDPWASLGKELQRCVLSLNKALQCIRIGEDLRLKIFHILFRLVEEQLYRVPNIGAEEAKQVILKQSRPMEREKIASWVEALQKRSFSFDESTFSGLEDFLIDLQKDKLEPEVYLMHYRETGQAIKWVESLLALGRIQEAQHVAQQKEFTSQTLALANLFVTSHQEAIAEKLVLNYSNTQLDLQALGWLKNFYQQQNNWLAALDVAKQLLDLAPQLGHYQAVRDLAQKLNQWSVLRQAIIAHFRLPQDGLLLIEIHLDEQAIEEAIRVFDALSPFSLYSFENSRYTLLALRLAESARSKHPLFALKIYQYLVESLIEERHRESYRRACIYLKIIYSIFEELHQKLKWEVYLKYLLRAHRRLHALKEEMENANLINRFTYTDTEQMTKKFGIF